MSIVLLLDHRLACLELGEAVRQRADLLLDPRDFLGAQLLEVGQGFGGGEVSSPTWPC
jgi:hypothetical protein